MQPGIIAAQTASLPQTHSAHPALESVQTSCKKKRFRLVGDSESVLGGGSPPLLTLTGHLRV
jgi:hypothetical protein